MPEWRRNDAVPSKYTEPLFSQASIIESNPSLTFQVVRSFDRYIFQRQSTWPSGRWYFYLRRYQWKWGCLFWSASSANVDKDGREWRQLRGTLQFADVSTPQRGWFILKALHRRLPQTISCFRRLGGIVSDNLEFSFGFRIAHNCSVNPLFVQCPPLSQSRCFHDF